MAKALWASDPPPGSMDELADLFKGARHRLELWKISACREGAREAWAMVKTRYTKLDPNHMARVGPLGSDGKEIHVSLVYDQVALVSLSNFVLQRTCFVPSRIVNHLSWRTFSLQPLEPTVRRFPNTRSVM